MFICLLWPVGLEHRMMSNRQGFWPSIINRGDELHCLVKTSTPVTRPRTARAQCGSSWPVTDTDVRCRSLTVCTIEDDPASHHGESSRGIDLDEQLASCNHSIEENDHRVFFDELVGARPPSRAVALRKSRRA